ncbi:unnamed protein product [Haemonchus placei]|uniref:RING-type domain-containing protein n=1 Tax=Haemonchus placei TaxID=6290 RepID=A0A0N4WAZ9_HAEPC|nr:unnamed protein product [Haemonchus placei]
MFASRSNAIRLEPMCSICGEAVALRDHFYCMRCLPMVIELADVVISDAITRKGGQRLCSSCRVDLKVGLMSKLLDNFIQPFRPNCEVAENGHDTSSTRVSMTSIRCDMQILVREGDIDEEIEEMIGRCRHTAMVGEERDNETGENASEKDGEQGEEEMIENVASEDGEEDEEVGENVLAKDGDGDGEETACEAPEKDGKESGKALAENVSTMEFEENEEVTSGNVFAMDLEEDGEGDGDEVLAKGVADKNGEARAAKDGEECEKVATDNVSAMDGEENGEQDEEEVFAKDEEEVVTEVVEDVFAISAEEVRGKAPTESAFAKDGGEGEGEITDYAPIEDGKGEKGMGDYVFVEHEKEDEEVTGELLLDKNEENDENMTADHVVGHLDMNPNANENDGIYDE